MFATPTKPPPTNQDPVPPLPQPMVNWLPTYSRDPTAALASLSVCHLNMDPACDFHAHRKSALYRAAWRAETGPVWCRADAPAPPPAPTVYGDRIGVALDVARAPPAAPPAAPPNRRRCVWSAGPDAAATAAGVL